MSSYAIKNIPTLLGLRFKKAAEKLYDMSDLRHYRAYGLKLNREQLENPDRETLVPGALPAYTIQRSATHVLYTPRLKEIEICSELESSTADAFVYDFTCALDNLPSYITDLFAEHALRFRLGRRMKDVFERAEEKARGHNCTLECLSAHYDVCAHAVDLVQEVKSRENDGFELATDNVYETALHELGHALDQIIDITNVHNRDERRGSLYQKEFIKAYKRDISHLKGQTHHGDSDLRYYLVRKHGGFQKESSYARSEVFAQLFAERISGGAQPLHRAFPETVRCMEKILKSLQAEMLATPAYGRINIRHSGTSPTLSL